ncbi:hypothetical protein D3C73_1618490 [compost metagenome]
MMGVDQVVGAFETKLGPPYVVLIGLDIFINDRIAGILLPVKGMELHILRTLAAYALGQGEQLHVPAFLDKPLLNVGHHR